MCRLLGINDNFLLLHQAIENSEFEVCRRLVYDKYSIYEVDKHKRNVFHITAVKGNTEIMRLL